MIESKAKLWASVILPFALGYFICTAFRAISAVLALPVMQALSLNADQFGFIASTYVLAFALTQPILGILLDQWGARRTQAALFCLGGIGIILFGLAHSTWLLAVGRTILGIGMAGGLMAAFKAITSSVAKQHIPFYNGVILAVGGLGALFATMPSKLIELHFGWRNLCFALGIATFIIAIIILLFAPRDHHTGTIKAVGQRWQQIKGLQQVYKSHYFWRMMPLFTTTLGGFIAMQGLWLGPWLQHINHLTAINAANYLLVIALAMTLGMISGGLFSHLEKISKIPLATIVIIGIIIHLISQIVIIANILPNNYIIWFVYGYFAQVTLVNYALLVQHFDIKRKQTTSAGRLL